MDSTTLKATTAGRARRRPKTFGSGRVCGDSGCATRLSQYNRNEYCFNHSPARFPRMRGEFTEEFLAKNEG